MKEISGNFIDLDAEDEEGRSSHFHVGVRLHAKRYSRLSLRRRKVLRLPTRPRG
jgi:hypothetical protein